MILTFNTEGRQDIDNKIRQMWKGNVNMTDAYFDFISNFNIPKTTGSVQFIKPRRTLCVIEGGKC